MSALDIFNPTKRLVSRLFLWFWITLASTALVGAWIGQLLTSQIELGTPGIRDIQLLERVASRVESRRRTQIPIQGFLRDLGMRERHAIVAIDLDNHRFVDSGPRVPVEDLEDLLSIAYQKNPITVQRGPMTFIGPKPFQVGERHYALFIGRLDENLNEAEEQLIWLIPIAVLFSTIWCYFFSMSVVQPIKELQERSRQLAQGDWGARVDIDRFGKDETGQLARDFNRMADQLESMWRGQQRLLADISHELRSPLARLQMALGIAEQQDIDVQTLDRVGREAERMEALINQLLKLTRTKASQVQFEKMPLSSWLKNILVDANFEATNLEKRVIYSDIPNIEAAVNQELMHSAIENVIRNAIRYANQVVDVHVAASASQWIVIITDDGPGLPTSECERVFEPFYRPSTSRERESGGAGLGLAIAKSAVDLHHGVLEASSKHGAGLSVTFRIPTSPNHYGIDDHSRN